jgi:hypothetical protein
MPENKNTLSFWAILACLKKFQFLSKKSYFCTLLNLTNG